MNIFKRIRWFFANRIYPSSDIIGYLVSSFINEGKLIKETEFYASIEYKNNIYNIWITNYPYAWLSKCNSTSKEDYELKYPTWETVWNETVPPKKVAMEFEDWLNKERNRLFDEQNFIKETDNTHQTQLKETTMTTETTFNAFDKVLVRDSNSEEWRPDFFQFYKEKDEDGDVCEFPYHTIGSMYRYCIPYEGNEELAGSTFPSEEQSFKEGDTIEFFRVRDDKWYRGTLAKISTRSEKGDDFTHKVDYVDNNGREDYIWCKPDQLREACVNVDAKKEEDTSTEYAFEEGEKVWYRGDYSGDKWTMGTVIAVDHNDPDLTYHVRLFTNDMTWWVNENTLKKIDDNPL